MRLILASGSPQRLTLLKGTGLAFEVIVPGVDEHADLPGRPRTDVAVANALAKARHVAAGHPDAVVIGADTIVVSAAGEILGKPVDEADAFRILSTLSGSTHSVITGMAVLWGVRGIEKTWAETTRITMRPIPAAELWDYIRTGHPFGKSGAYGIQKVGDRFFEDVDGDFDNVVGLPVKGLMRMLGELGAG